MFSCNDEHAKCLGQSSQTDVHSNPFPSDRDIGVWRITTLFLRYREPSGNGLDGGSLLLLQIPHRPYLRVSLTRLRVIMALGMPAFLAWRAELAQEAREADGNASRKTRIWQGSDSQHRAFLNRSSQLYCCPS